MPYNAMKNRAFVPEEKFMREALSLAEEAFSAGEVPVGAVVVKDGEVIGRGRNRREEHQSVLGHAELEAMEQAARGDDVGLRSGTQATNEVGGCGTCLRGFRGSVNGGERGCGIGHDGPLSKECVLFWSASLPHVAPPARRAVR